MRARSSWMMILVGTCGLVAPPALGGNSQIRVSADVQGQGTVDIGSIEVDDNDGMGGGITGTFTFGDGFGFLDEWYNFRWVNIQTGYSVDGVPQDTDPLLGTLPAVDPAPGPFPGSQDFNDPAPFYFTNEEHANCMADGFGQICDPGVSSTFSDNRSDPAGVNSVITFETYLVVESVTDENIPSTTFCVLAGFEWTYDNSTGAQTQTQSITNPSADGINEALGHANDPGFDNAWMATTSCTLEECPSVLDCVFTDSPGTFFSPSVWTRDGEEIGRTFEDGVIPLPGKPSYDFTYLPTEPNDWHWGVITADGSNVMVWVENIPPDTPVTVEIVTSPKFPQTMLLVDVGNDRYDITQFDQVSDCCQPHDFPGCSDPKCQQLVCEIEPICCDLAWDPFCAQLAMELCGGLCQQPPIWSGFWSQYPGDIPPSLGFFPNGDVRQMALEGPPQDCNGNGVPDDQDIAKGNSFDSNANGVPDECEAQAVVKQISWRDNADGFVQRFSDFGALTVTLPEPLPGTIGWLNAVVDGNWVVQNAPIIGMNGLPGQPHDYTFKFDLRNEPTIPVEIVQLQLVGISPVQIEEPPLFLPPIEIPVQESQQHPGQRFALKPPLGPILPVGPVDFINPFLPIAWEAVTRTGVPGVQEADNHCAPGAGARSLAWMNDTYCLNLRDDCDEASEIYDKLRDGDHMMTDPEDGTSDDNIVSGLEQLIMEKMLQGQLTVGLSTALTVDDAFEALKQGKDVMGLLFYDDDDGGGHIFCITGMVRCGDEITILYRDDEEQGDDSMGDTGTQETRYDETDGTLPGFGSTATWDGFAFICPTRKTQLDAAAKWLFGDIAGGGSVEGLIPLLQRLLDEPPTPQDVLRLLEYACAAETSACGMFEQLTQQPVPDNVFIAALGLKLATQQAKANVIDYAKSFLANAPDPTFLTGALEALQNVEPQIAKVDGYIDCNDNGVDDERDIALETSADTNGNGVPDECECLADTDGNNQVDVDDLVNVILDWGTDGSAHNSDVNNDGVVNVDDLVEVILAWGPCEGT